MLWLASDSHLFADAAAAAEEVIHEWLLFLGEARNKIIASAGSTSEYSTELVPEQNKLQSPLF
jgi:hypothetical protein